MARLLSAVFSSLMPSSWPPGKRPLLLPVALLGTLLAGCATSFEDRPLTETLPATFTGALPCAQPATPQCDAPSQLVLMPDQLFVLSEQPPGGEAAPAIRLGRWLLSTDGRQLRLYATDTAPLTLEVTGASQLRLSTPTGTAGAVLQRVRQRSGETPRLQLRGMYQPPAEGERLASFRECQSGVVMSVAAGEAAEQMAALYAHERRPAAGRAPLLMAVSGRIDGARSTPSQLRLQVEQLTGVTPELQCETRAANAPLVGSRWQLVEVDGYRLPEGEQRPPFLQFDEQGGVAGSTGCNRLVGRYTQTGGALVLSELATTRMSCPGAAVLEQLVTDLVRRVARWNILESTLELYDDSGTLLGRFEVRSPTAGE